MRLKLGWTALVALILVGVLLFISEHYLQKKRPFESISSPIEEKSFVLIIPSYNNERYIDKNLRSVFTQKYDNFRVIYIDDHSSDTTPVLARRLIQELDSERRTILLHNSENRGALANLYHAIHSCKDEEIVVLLDGDDFLAHEEVLSILNRTYANPEVWMTYGNFLDYPTYTQKPVQCKPLSARVVKKNLFRKNTWVTSHLRTFYAGLFKKIALKDLLHHSEFYPMAWDLALMLPMLEMSGSHVQFIPDILYLYNRTNPLSDHRVNFGLQERLSQKIQDLAAYQPIENLKFGEHAAEEFSTNVLLFSHDQPSSLYALLESLEPWQQLFSSITVFYSFEQKEMLKGYEIVFKNFPKVSFFPLSDLNWQTIAAASDYLLIANDQFLFKPCLNLQNCISALKSTQADCLLLQSKTDMYLNKPIPFSLFLKEMENGEALHLIKGETPNQPMLITASAIQRTLQEPSLSPLIKIFLQTPQLVEIDPKLVRNVEENLFHFCNKKKLNLVPLIGNETLQALPWVERFSE